MIRINHSPVLTTLQCFAALCHGSSSIFFGGRGGGSRPTFPVFLFMNTLHAQDKQMDVFLYSFLNLMCRDQFFFSAAASNMSTKHILDAFKCTMNAQYSHFIPDAWEHGEH